ncbi:MAG: uroporphyrinogen decarboxylase family protein [Promethearchaeota archaeon]
MDAMDPKERVLTTFNHEEPDRLPIYEGTIELPELNQGRAVNLHPGLLFYSAGVLRYLTAPWFRPFLHIYKKLLENGSTMSFLLTPMIKPVINGIIAPYVRLGIDMVTLVGGLPAVLNPRIFEDASFKKIGRDQVVFSPAGDVATRISGAGGGAVHRNGFLRSPADYDKYIEFDADSRLNTFLTGKIIKRTAGRIFTGFSVFGAAYFENLCELFGYETLFHLLLKEPVFIRKVVKDMSDYSIAVARRLLADGAQVIYMTDDLGQKGRMLISPRMYRKFFKPSIKKFCDAVHREGGKVMMHSDGYLLDVVPDLIESGVDALHPWESDAGMDIFSGKKRWDSMLTLFGNVPIELLTRGTPGMVERYVMDLIRNVSPGGGYVISSSHSIVSTCKLENYLTMLKTVRKYGKYGGM